MLMKITHSHFVVTKKLTMHELQWQYQINSVIIT